MSQENTVCPYCGSEDFIPINQIEEMEWMPFKGQSRPPKLVWKFRRQCRQCRSMYELWISKDKNNNR